MHMHKECVGRSEFLHIFDFVLMTDFIEERFEADRFSFRPAGEAAA